MDLTTPIPQIQLFHSHANKVKETIKVLHNIKKEIITKLEEVKQKIRISASRSPEKRPSAFVKDKTISLLDRDISHIQNVHDVVVRDLHDLKKHLDHHIAIIEKTELIMNILNYKLYEIQYEFRSQLNKLKEKKERLIKTSGQDPTVAIQIVEIDDEISNLEDNQQKELSCVKEQKIDAQLAYERACVVMDHDFEKMTNGYNKLLLLIEAEKSTLSDSQSKLIDTKFANEVENFKSDIEKFTELQTTGWKILYPEEKISELLEQRGLKILHSGILTTEDGQIISFKQAKASKLLDDLSPQYLEELKANIKNNADVSNLSSKSDLSAASKLSSEDINYLKIHLGKPLTLAIAEITALQPRDPIHYLGHWLFKYRYNQQIEDVNSIEFDILNEKRNKLAKERWHKFVEEEAKAAVIEMIIRAEEIGMMNELHRIQIEEEEMEDENYEDEARDILGQYTGPQTGERPLN